MSAGACPPGSLCGPPDLLGLLLEWQKPGRLEEFKAALSGEADEGADEGAVGGGGGGGGGVDLNRVYEPQFVTLLDKASEIDRSGGFVRALLEAGANPNTRNEPHEARTPLHFAARARNPAALRELLALGAKRKGEVADVAAVDADDNTVLHDLCKKYRLRHKLEDEALEVKNCLLLVLGCSKLPANHTNRQGRTAVYIAASEKRQEIVRTLLEHKVKVDVDKSDKTARQVIKETFNDVFDEQLNAIDHAEKDIQLMDYLINGDVGGFLALLEKKKGTEEKKKETERGKFWLDANDGTYTLLQKAVNDRQFDDTLIDVIKSLLENDADPSLTSPGFSTLPTQIAARNGDNEVLKLLCDKGAKITDHDGKTALHDVIERDNDPSKYQKYKECFDILIEHINKYDLNDINSQDINKNTPLHLAVKYGKEYFTLKLLEQGAYIGIKNKFGDPPMAEMSSDTLRKFLNSCVTSEKSPRDEDYKVMFDVKFLKPQDESPSNCDSNSVRYHKEAVPCCDNSVRTRYESVPCCHSHSINVSIPDDRVPTNPIECECAPLLYISKVKDLRSVLNHPVFTSFLEIKWRGIRPFFWINLCFYVLFVSLLTIYILFYYESVSMGDLKDLTIEENNPAALTKPSSESQSKNATENDPGSQISSSIGCKAIWIIVAALFIILVLREMFQLIVALKHYICSFENYLEILILVSCGFVLFHPSVGPRMRPHLSAITILLSWAELVLLIGRHPQLSTNIEMLKTVSKNFLKFLAWYSLLIFAFALSFYSLFRSSTEEDNFFLDPGSSFFKTVVMVTGEFEAGELPFVMFPGTSHVVFVLFVFLVAIVLFNLLNGLAVSDTQAIREDAELVAIVSRIKLISYTEKILLSHPFWCRRQNSNCCFFQAFTCLKKLPCSLINQTKKVRLFPFVLPDGKISVLPNMAGKISFSTECLKANSKEYYWHLDSHYYLDVSILKAADKILQSQRNNPCSEVCTHSEIIAQLQAKLEDLNKTSQKNQAKLDDLNETSQKNQEMLQKIMQLLENAYNSQLIKSEHDINM